MLDGCRELSGAPPIRFVAGMGLNATCGNPGDKVDALDAIAVAGTRGGVGQQGDLSSARRDMRWWIRQRGRVTAVYPRDQRNGPALH
ncbi:hypothetical protein IA54_009690 [Xanthomonas phaseoli pv. syngonii LMG 9055]|uniref:Uncharacterized protein n=1 Tax=Xanthomonas phaseoli pv. syngonii LMG 9055 TaxID=1437878 RepID=A0A1V9GZR3_9XANT|nr:hypothetical protein IA54_009690 [Xanthomonas phaseoli pv. syngonii LMG 9055]